MIPARLFLALACAISILSCHNSSPSPEEKKIVTNPLDMDEEASKSIKAALAYALEHNGSVGDSLQVKMISPVNDFYISKEYTNIWSHDEKWQPLADSLVNFIEAGELYGLFPKDYRVKKLRDIKTVLATDSLKRMDAAQWTRADLLLTDEFMHLAKDLRIGRLAPDSILFNKNDTSLKKDFYTSTLNDLLEHKLFSEVVQALEPPQHGYHQLKESIPHFIDSMDRKVYTYVNYPFKSNDAKDSLNFVKSLQKRLKENNCIEQDTHLADSTQLDAAVRKFQKKRGLKNRW